MIRHIFIILLIFPCCLYGQKQDEAIILENKAVVYSKASFGSDKTYILQKNEVFLLAENEEIDKEWVQVEIHQNKLSKIPELQKNFFITGFIPRANICLVDSLPEDETNKIALKFGIVKADPSQKIAQNKIRYGLEVPIDVSYVVNEMFLDWKGKLIKQHRKYFDDLFNISFQEGVYSSKEIGRFSIHNLDDFAFIKQQCGDGAGSYEITWVIKDGFIIQRMVDEI